ncbi:MAG: hypothetical protein IPM98_07265 [Lewinellaceae bacterium]|nr:hypothetical protein [Lewinellaceae bacterium]
MKTLLEIRFRGWTATPRMPFVLSGNAICLPVPSYSLVLGLVGCCVGRPVEPEEVRLGFRYQIDTSAEDIETRHRLEFDGKRVKAHSKGTDAYPREFHVNPRLTVWLDRLDWEDFFRFPIGTPALGRSQDLLEIDRKSIRQVEVQPVTEASIGGCMLPFRPQLRMAGQLVQLAEAYRENDIVGSGRTATQSRIFLAVPADNEVPIVFDNLFRTAENESFYLHQWA